MGTSVAAAGASWYPRPVHVLVRLRSYLGPGAIDLDARHPDHAAGGFASSLLRTSEYGHVVLTNAIDAVDLTDGGLLRTWSLGLSIANTGAPIHGNRLYVVGESAGGTPGVSVQLGERDRAIGWADVTRAKSPYLGNNNDWAVAVDPWTAVARRGGRRGVVGAAPDRFRSPAFSHATAR